MQPSLFASISLLLVPLCAPAMAPPHVNYSLYLVTDSTPALLRGKDLCAVVDAAIRGGVTVVQYRDKTSDTGVLIATAKRLHAITSQHKVPLLINDRVDVALAVGCEGVHLGQDDMGLWPPPPAAAPPSPAARGLTALSQTLAPPAPSWDRTRSLASRPTVSTRLDAHANRAPTTWALAPFFRRRRAYFAYQPPPPRGRDG